MKLLFLTDLHMTDFIQQPEGFYVRIPAHALQLLSRRYDLMGYLLPLALQQALAELAPDFVVLGGDLVDDGFGPRGQKELLFVSEIIAQNISAAAADTRIGWLYGNHDGPQEQFAQRLNKLNWTADFHKVRIVGLNSGSMNPEAEEESSHVALRHLQEALATNEGRHVLICLHQWLWPPDVRGYSFARAPEALELIQDDPNVVAVISGHYHNGRYEERYGIHFCTARAFAEPPFCYSTFYINDGQLIWEEYEWQPTEQKFILSWQRQCQLRG